MNGNRKGFTLVELLVVIAIIAMLMSLAVPALSRARLQARIVGDRASLSAMSTAIESFANEMGYYPDSDPRPAIDTGSSWQGDNNPTTNDRFDIIDTGAHRLADALFGIDRIGYTNVDNGDATGDPNPDDIPDYNIHLDTGETVDAIGQPVIRNGPYIKLESVNIGTMVDAGAVDPLLTNNRNPVLLDTVNLRQARAILYYRVNRREHLILNMYEYDDNRLITADVDSSSGTAFPMYPDVDDPCELAIFMWDRDTGTGDEDYMPYFPAIRPGSRPYNMASFILINAGPDGLYGTADDITNW